MSDGRSGAVGSRSRSVTTQQPATNAPWLSAAETAASLSKLAAVADAPKRPLTPIGWWPIAWYPAAFPVAYIIAIWSASAIHPSWLGRPVIVTIALVLTLTVVLSRLLGDRNRGGLSASAVAVALLITDSAVRTVILLVAAIIAVVGLGRRGRRWGVRRRITAS